MEIKEIIGIILLIVLLAIAFLAVVASLTLDRSPLSPKDEHLMSIQYGDICQVCHREWRDKKEYVEMCKGEPITCPECLIKEAE